MKAILLKIKEFIKTLDKALIVICLASSAISLLCMYSFYATGQRQFRVLLIQAVGVGLGLVIAFIISIFDYHFLAKLWKLYMPVAVFLVILTYFIGTGGGYGDLADDKAWLDLGFTTLQPSELLKLSFIFTFSLHLSEVGEDINKLKPFLLLCLHGALPCGMVMYQGDYGTALVFFAIFVVMMFVAGLSVKLIIVGIVASAIAAPFVWFVILPDYLKLRFLVAQHPENYLTDIWGGKGWQQYKGRISIGSGGLDGRGMFYDNMYKVPEYHNDFIFSYIGQIFGFVGTIVTLLLITSLCVKILMNAKLSKDNLGNYICIGVFAMFMFQSIINIGMVLCVTPVIGITLPFFSAGGTSVVVSYMAIGMVLSVYRENKKDLMFD